MAHPGGEPAPERTTGAAAARSDAPDQLERFFALSGDLLCVVDFAGGFRRVNPSFERVLGHPREVFLREPILSFVHPDDREATMQAFETVASGTEVRGFENRYLCRDGGYRWLQWTTATDLDAGLLYAAARDVTETRRLADEQAALRRVAIAVAEERPATEVFATVAAEAGRVLELEDTRMVRFESDGTATVVASWGRLAGALPVGTSISMQGDSASALVHRSGRSARIDDFTGRHGAFADLLRGLGVRSAVGAPIVVDGRLWGALSTASLRPEPLPAGTEERIRQFTELVATAISNTEAREDLAASRRRIVAAADEERRRVVRDLHDGAQQRLVQTVLTMKLALRAAEQGEDPVPLVQEALEHAERATTELRELSHGILPAVLVHGGLRAGVEDLASRAPVPVETTVVADRLPPAIEATGYFVVAEALTNVAKHARARRAEVTVRADGRVLRVRVRDDGVGGARPGGTGLVGLADRLAALDGVLRVESPAAGGTLVAADIPIPA